MVEGNRRNTPKVKILLRDLLRVEYYIFQDFKTSSLTYPSAKSSGNVRLTGPIGPRKRAFRKRCSCSKPHTEGCGGIYPGKATGICMMLMPPLQTGLRL